MRNFLLIFLFSFLYTHLFSQINYPRIDVKPVISKNYFSGINEFTENKTISKLIEELKKTKKKSDTLLAKKIERILERKSKKVFEEPASRISIEGLGNISNSQNGENLNPSANIYARMLPIKKDPNFRIYIGFNLGAEVDSTKIDSIKLGSLFLPEKGKAGYSARIEYNILPVLGKNTSYDEKEKYNYITELSPFIEYNYNKINIKDAFPDSSRIQTSTWIIGINFSHAISIGNNENLIGLQIQPYYKSVTVTDGTLGLYRKIFEPALKGASSPQTIKFIGLTLGLQINRFQFSFILDDLKNKKLKDTPLYGGVYTIRATVIGDLIKL